MPYRVLVCKACDMMVHEGGPHGPEDEYCEGDLGFEWIEVFTQQEVDRRVEAAGRDGFRQAYGDGAFGTSDGSKEWYG